MPSLRDLEEFKASFLNIGDEARILRALNLPLDDFPLPDQEASVLAAPAPASQSPERETPDADAGGIFADDGFADMAIDGQSSGGAEEDLFNVGDLGDLVGSMNEAPGPEDDFPEFASLDASENPPAGEADGLDFESFIDSIPDDFSQNTGALSGGLDEEPAGPGGETDETPGDDPGFPEDLLNGFADEIEAERASEGFSGEGFSEEDSGEPGLDETPFGDFGADAFEGLGSGETLEMFSEEPSEGQAPPGSAGPEPAAAEAFPGGESPDGADFGDMGFGDAAAPDPNALDGDFPAFDFPGEDPSGFSLDDGFPAFEETDGEGSEAFSGGDAAFTEFPAFAEESAGDFSGDAVEQDDFGSDGFGSMDFPAGDENFDMGGESPGFDAGAILKDISGDSFDNFKLDADSLAQNFDMGGIDSGEFGDELGNLDDFSLASVFDGKSGGGTRPQARGGGAAGKTPGGPGADEVEEITLSPEELARFQKTLSSYPLNLRIACEELIAEQAVAPDQMSRLVKLLVSGAPAGETAALAGKILGRTIPVPRGFEKKTGAALETEQSSFAYIFVHNFLPVLRLFMSVALVALSLGYLGWRFIYTPLRAEEIYRLGIERIGAGEYSRANGRFLEAWNIHQKKSWFYTYARAFSEARQYNLAEEKYRELLYYTASKDKRGIPEKAAVLEYADMETRVIGNYEAADGIIRRNILDYYPWDAEALLALGDNSLAWGEYEPARYEEARESYAKYMERYGRADPLLERMLIYFIRTDNLGQVLPLQSYFMASEKRNISAGGLAELGGYLLDKRYTKTPGVPNEYLDSIGGIRDVLLRAIRQDPLLPEPYYHLARYYYHYENFNDERLTLERAVRIFDAAKEENSGRIKLRIFALRRYAEILTGGREFIPAEEYLEEAREIYTDAQSRRLLGRSPEFGRLYADLGDLEYFSQNGDIQSALDNYRLGEEDGWAPPEIQYRMGAIHYQLREWGEAQDRLTSAYREIAPNRRILYALGNVSYMRGNYFAAQGYYDKLLEMLEDDRLRYPPIQSTDDEGQLNLAERLMVAQNNLGVTLDALTERTGDNRYRSRAQGLYSDSARAWDILTRNPVTMLRMRPSPDLNAPGVNPGYLNINNNLYPVSGYDPLFFLRIDKDILEPSRWEELAPPGYRLSEGINTAR